MPWENFLNSSFICSASSRVGAIIKTFFDLFAKHFSISGSKNAAVFPVPVLAKPIKSLPFKMWPIDLSWTGVGMQ